MTSREQFEAWFKPKKESMKSCGLGLISIRRAHDAALDAWQASREAVEVELPSFDKQVKWGAAKISVDLSQQKKQCEEAIRAAGIKVKGEW